MARCMRSTLVLFVALAAQLPAAELKVLLPQGRVAYQTNESIAVAVVRSDTKALPAASLTVTLAGTDASKLVFQFPLPPAAADAKGVSATEHLTLDGRLLRPGKYTLEAAAHGAAATSEFEVYSHLRRSSYRVVHWCCTATKKQQALLGEDSLGFNLVLNPPPATDDMVRGGVDFMGNCLMGGMHQHDGRMECDWSDPYATGGAVQRAMVRAYPFRSWGNMIGAHLHDEPGLTYSKHPRSGALGPYDVPQQRAAYQRFYGEEPIWSDQVHPEQPESMARWTKYNDVRLGFMEAFWRQARYPLDKMKPGYLSATQSHYGWHALADGHYFNVARSLPVICGHGGYDDYWLMSLNPSFFLEFSLPRQTEQPTWYLPEWFDMSSEKYRLEHYMCFMTGIAGLCTPPHTPWQPGKLTNDGIVETNKLMGALGTIFARPALTRQDVAILFSKSALYSAVAKSGSHRDNEQTEKMAQLYLATKMTQYPINAVLDEDVLDGTLAANQKAVLLTGIHYLDPAVKAALEGFAAGGGVVLVTDDCGATIAGATKLGVRNDRYWNAGEARIAQIADPKQREVENGRMRALVRWVAWCQPLAKALKANLLKSGIKPVLETDAEGLAAGLQRRGEVDYVFAVNFTPTEDVSNTPKAIEAALALPLAGRAVYDAVRGGPPTELDPAGKGQVRFGAGQMRVFAVTARPIGGVQVTAAMASADPTREADPIAVQLAAIVLDGKGGVLAGSVPMQIQVIDPLGEVRYDLHRAAEQGVLGLSLPLAVNDPAGAWKVKVRELLSNTEGTGSFTYRPAAVCGAVAGAVPRALMFAPDRKNIYNLCQAHKALTIVTGTGEDVAAAAQRLAQNLKPYDVQCTIVEAASVKPRQLTPEERKTWTAYGGVSANDPMSNGYDLPGPAVLIGNAKNNPVMALVAQPKKWHGEMASLMPYEPSELVPGRGRGMIGWHLYPVGRRLETVALLADDAAGLHEAVGTLTEIVAGMEPLLPALPPATSRIAAATVPRPRPAEPSVAWRVVLPDRAASIKAEGGQTIIHSLDGTLSTLDSSGKVVAQKLGPVPVIAKGGPVGVPAALKDKLAGNRLPKFVAADKDLSAVGYWGGMLQVFDLQGNVKAQQQLPQDFAALAWQGDKLIVGLADGRVLALAVQ